MTALLLDDPIPAAFEFRKWPKTSRLFRECVITEKIDGTFGGIRIVERNFGEQLVLDDKPDPTVLAVTFGPPKMANDGVPAFEYWIGAQSKNRMLTTTDDNFGFAKWVQSNAVSLVQDLGEGSHFGEWWGAGIQRKYGTSFKNFSLFESRTLGDWSELPEFDTPALNVAPPLYVGEYYEGVVSECLSRLQENGSQVAPLGWPTPEGVVIKFKTGERFKVTLDNNDRGKWEGDVTL